jgi:hypothetical protein
MLNLLFLVFFSSHLAACNPDQGASPEPSQVENSKGPSITAGMKLKITVGEKVLTATQCIF